VNGNRLFGRVKQTAIIALPYHVRHTHSESLNIEARLTVQGRLLIANDRPYVVQVIGSSDNPRYASNDSVVQSIAVVTDASRESLSSFH
jgi:hypothetical protein